MILEKLPTNKKEASKIIRALEKEVKAMEREDRRMSDRKKDENEYYIEEYNLNLGAAKGRVDMAEGIFALMFP